MDLIERLHNLGQNKGLQACSEAADEIERVRGAATFQARNAAWMAEAMADDPTDLPERVARFGEEALELQQALGQTREDSHALVDYVFDRPAGQPAQEMGGTMTTLALLAVVARLDMVECGERELARCSTAAVLAKIRGKRAGRAGRGPLPGITPAIVAGETFDTIRQWAEETFGPITPERTIERAGEEFEELRAAPDDISEAADVVICLARIPGLWAEVERKMGVNRGRRWRLVGDGTGYHVKPGAPVAGQYVAAPVVKRTHSA